MESLYEKLHSYSESDYYPFHMPGHKRQGTDKLSFVEKIDITEIEGFDDLYHSKEILKRAQNRAAQLYGSEESYFLVNGSTGGILTAISAACSSGSTVIMARNCHKSAYNAVMLRKLKVRYLYPEYIKEFETLGGITRKQVKEAIEKNPKASAVVLVSPTYDGFVSDIAGIVEEAHNNNIPVIVDEAHGAFFGLSDKVPQNAVRYGADLVIHSLHKTLPALTQTALLHVQGNRILKEKVKKYLEVYQTSSPSYVLMASMDECMISLLEKKEEFIYNLFTNRKAFLEKVKDLEKIKIASGKLEGNYGIEKMDPGKLLISVNGTDGKGKELYQLLYEKYHLQMEMVQESYVVAIITGRDTKEGFERLAKALHEIDKTLCLKEKEETIIRYPEDFIELTIGEAEEKEQERIDFAASEGRISGEFIYLYPPGIPIVAPGEVISASKKELIEHYKREKLNIRGLSDVQGNTILVVK